MEDDGFRSGSAPGRAMAVLRRMTGHMALPLDLAPLRGLCLLHVSDTPSTFYGDLGRIVAFLRPLALIHTGDVVDDVKLERRPRELGLYRRRLAALFRRLPAFSEGLFIACGNHDDARSLVEAAPAATVIEGGALLAVAGLRLALAHSLAELPLPPQPFNLFGHCPSARDLSTEENTYLNGLEALSVLSLEGAVHRLPYPSYVDDDRCCRRKIGL